MSQGKFNWKNVVKLTEEEVAHYNNLWGVGTKACFLFAGAADKVYANHSQEWFALKCEHGWYRIKSFAALANDGLGWDGPQGTASSLKGVKEVMTNLINEQEDLKKGLNPWV